MLPTTLSVLTILASEIAQSIWEDLMESRARARQICDEAKAACALAAEFIQATDETHDRAQQARSILAQHLAAGVRRRHKGRAR